MKADIAIIGAMEPEVKELLGLLKRHRVKTVAGVDLHLGRLCGKRVVIAKCGIGKVFAALCTQIIIDRYKPKLIVNTGVGGAVAEGLSTGDIVIASGLCQHDMDTSAIGDPKGLVSGINKIFFEADKRAIDLLKCFADEKGYSSTVGRIATGDKFIATAEEKRRIASEFSASACEMEGCAVAQVAFVNSTPFAVVRAISDSADGEATMDYPTFLPLAAHRSADLTLSLVREYKL